MVESLKLHGLDLLFTLNGGHLFPVYEACVRRGLRLIDVRHEQTAVFAAEGLAKLQRRPAAAALTAGPGVTNGVSAIATAAFNGTPLLVIGGRAPQARWGSGSLQEIDHLPLVRSITKSAQTVFRPDQIPAVIAAALNTARTPHRGPVFLDIPLDVAFASAEVSEASPLEPPRRQPDPELLDRVAALVAGAHAPVLVVGSDLYWAEAWPALRRAVEAGNLPTFASSLGRGCLPADHPLAFARARGLALRAADLVVVAGAPLDFRLNFGRLGAARLVHLCDAPEQVARHVALEASVVGDLGLVLDGLASRLEAAPRPPAERGSWLARLRGEEQKQAATDEDLLSSSAEPIHPARIYGELRRLLDRDAIIIGDGGDFVSFGGRYLPSYRPGAWLEPGPFGCLGTGLGYAIAARLAHPDRQVVVLFGDGAFGFSAMDFDTLVRFRLPVTAVCGNNGVWGLEKHPMRMLYGFDAAADLQPGCRYDRLVESLGGFGQLVTRPDEIAPALRRAFASGQPALVNILTDPNVAYPRSANLA